MESSYQSKGVKLLQSRSKNGQSWNRCLDDLKWKSGQLFCNISRNMSVTYLWESVHSAAHDRYAKTTQLATLIRHSHHRNQFPAQLRWAIVPVGVVVDFLGNSLQTGANHFPCKAVKEKLQENTAANHKVLNQHEWQFLRVLWTKCIINDPLEYVANEQIALTKSIWNKEVHSWQTVPAATMKIIKLANFENLSKILKTKWTKIRTLSERKHSLTNSRISWWNRTVSTKRFFKTKRASGVFLSAGNLALGTTFGKFSGRQWLCSTYSSPNSEIMDLKSTTLAAKYNVMVKNMASVVDQTIAAPIANKIPRMYASW